MLTLNLTQRKPRFVPVELGDGASLKVEVTPPTFVQILEARAAASVAESMQVRLSCVTNWRDVWEESEVQPGVNARVEIPFSQSSLAALCGAYPNAVAKLLEVVKPLFAGEPKRAPETTTGAPETSTNCTGPFADSATLETPSGSASPS